MKRSMLKKISAAVLSAALALSCAACTAQSEEASGKAKGRYVESTLALPASAHCPHALAEVDGKLRLLGSDAVYESEDGGKTWSRQDPGSPALRALLSDKSEVGVCSAKWSAQGDLLFSTYDYDQSTGQENWHYYIYDKDGNERELNIDLPQLDLDDAFTMDYDTDASSEAASDEAGDETTGSFSTAGTFVVGGDGDGTFFLPANNLSQLDFLPDGSLVGLDQSGILYHVDKDTGEILHTVEPEGSEGYFSGMAATGDTLAVLFGTGAVLVDLSTWQRKGADKVLDDFLSGRREGEGDAVSSSTVTTTNYAYDGGMAFVGGENRIFAHPKENALYIYNSQGIYRHLLGGSAIEQVVNGSMCSLADPSFGVDEMLKSDGGDFFAACHEEKGREYTYLLANYTFDPDMSATPETELKAYTLFDDPNIYQYIALYQKTHPDVYINLEVGYTGSTAVTESDALRALNANIMAGNGPDLLFLNGMSIENYLNKGLLTDLSAVVEEAAGQGRLLEGILRACEKDGKICAVPTRFKCTIVTGQKAVVDSIRNLSTLADAVERLRRDHPEQKTILGPNRAFSLLDRLTLLNAPAWVESDGTLNREKLTDYLRQCKRICDVDQADQEDEGDGDAVTYSMSGMGDLLGVDLLKNDALMTIEPMEEANGLGCLVSVFDQVEDSSWAPLPGQAENVFTPVSVVGVSAKSEQADKAKDVVRFILSQEGQQFSGTGMPISLDAMEGLLPVDGQVRQGIAIMRGGDDMITLRVRNPSAKELAGMEEIFARLDTPASLDRDLYWAVMDQGTGYLLGDQDLEAAVEAISKEVALHLAEQ